MLESDSILVLRTLVVSSPAINTVFTLVSQSLEMDSGSALELFLLPEFPLFAV